MSRIARSWQLTRSCFRILRRHRSLAVLPVIAAVVVPLEALTVLVGCALLLGVDSAAAMDAFLAAEKTHGHWRTGSVMAVTYIVTHLTVSFLHGAFAWCVLAALEGRPARLRDGFRAAFRALPRLFVWTLITTVAQVLIDLVRRSIGGWLGNTIAGVNLAAWSFATLLVVPVLVSEEGGAVAGIRRAMTLFKRTWGEQALMHVGFSLAFLGLALGGACAAAAVAGAGALVIGAIAAPAESVALGVAGMSAVLGGLALFGWWLVVLAIVGECLSQIYRATLYSYAVTGMLPEEIAPELMPARKAS